MTEFGKALENVKRYLFWDFVGDRMLDTLQTPLDRDYFNRLMSVLVEAHDADIAKYDAENAKLRELVDGLRYCANESHGHGRCSVRFVDGCVTYCPLYDVDSDTARCEALLRELGVEVGE